MAGHFLAFEYTSRGLVLADRPRDSMREAIAVTCILRSEVVSLDGPGEAFAFANTPNIDRLTGFETSHRQLVAELITAWFFGRIQAKLVKCSGGFHAGLSEMSGLGPRQARSLARPRRNLDRSIAIRFVRLDLTDAIWLNLDDGHRDGLTILLEDTRHTPFATH